MSNRMGKRGGFALISAVLVVVLALGLLYHVMWTTLQTLNLWQDPVFVSVFQVVALRVTVSLTVVTAILVGLWASLDAWLARRAGRVADRGGAEGLGGRRREACPSYRARPSGARRRSRPVDARGPRGAAGGLPVPAARSPDVPAAPAARAAGVGRLHGHPRIHSARS